MQREKYPEKFPFRLTRMLINAMEVSGIEGNFRSTCESVMTVLRENKESLMAVLEAFVYDPLINWRLMTPNTAKAEAGGGGGLGTGAGDEEEEEESRDSPKSVALGAKRVGAKVVGGEDGGTDGEQLNERAITIIARISNKLTGRDFSPNEELKVAVQVDRLITQATNQEHLAQAYVGWCAFW